MAETASPQVEVIVTVAADRLQQFDQMITALKGRGLNVTQTLTSLGMVSGTASADALGGLRSLDGVAGVETEGRVEIAPPGSDLQ